ncbi:hypothetical protein [Halorussus sp. AFM4]|uniref:hypothetical protein n=1 Tax=Halorussus sp. AFM4 TaxID=3421651 RepID=UPI003EB7551F
MSQQYQPTSRGVQQSRGIGQQGQQSQQYQPAHFDEALPSEYRTTLEDLSWLRKQTKWASERAHVTLQGTGIETTLEDVSEIAELNEELILSGSKFVQHEIDTFRRIATEAIQELQQYQQQEPFVEAVISDLTRALHSAEELLASSPGQTRQAGGRSQGQQGGQSVGVQGQQSQFGQQGQSQIQPQTQGQQPMQSQPQTQSQPYGQSQY